MNGTALVPALGRPPAVDVPASYARYARRELEREGIPMVLALHDARTGAPPRVTDPVALAEGARLAELFDAYEAGMAEAVAAAEAAPGPDLTGGAPLITVLVVLAEEHLRARIDGDGVDGDGMDGDGMDGDGMDGDGMDGDGMDGDGMDGDVDGNDVGDDDGVHVVHDGADRQGVGEVAPP